MRISVIVPNLNYGRYLPDCLASIAAQTHADVEVFMIDAGSTDGSQQIMERYAQTAGWRFFLRSGESQIESISWGLTKATGSVQCWLNSDDQFLTRDALQRVCHTFEMYPGLDCLSMGGYYLDNHGHYTHKILLQTHPLLTQKDLAQRLGIVQPATFWKREVFQEIGFDHRLPYSFDSDFFVLAARKFNFLLDQDEIIAGYRLHGSNLSVGIKPQRIKELAILNEKHFGRGSRFFYLYGLSYLVRACESLPPPVSNILKRLIYVANNLTAYLTIYRWPAI